MGSKEGCMATLVVVKGPAVGAKFALEAHPLVMVGRDPRSTFQIVDSTVSRMHMQMRYDADAGCHYAKDFESRHGVVVNGEKIAGERKLNHGDQIGIGESTIIFSTDDSPDVN